MGGCLSSSDNNTGTTPNTSAFDANLSSQDQRDSKQATRPSLGTHEVPQPTSLAAGISESAPSPGHRAAVAQKYRVEEGALTATVTNITTESRSRSKLRTDRRVRDLYTLGKVLGTGASSLVRLATEKSTGTQYACKVMAIPPAEAVDPGSPALNATDSAMRLQDAKGHHRSMSGTNCDNLVPCASSRDMIFREIDILCNLDHERILHLKEYFEERNRVYLITELLTGGELLEDVQEKGGYTEEQARTCFAQLVSGIQYMHSRDVVHRDLKLENILLKRQGDISDIKIADFGLAKTVADDMQTACGTFQYVAPEVILRPDSGQYGPLVDMWSAGVILFGMLSGNLPFQADAELQLIEKIITGSYSFADPIWQNISASALDLISKLLVVDPAKRLSASQALQHPWLNGRRS